LIENQHKISNFVWIMKDGKQMANQTQAPATITEDQNGKGKL